MDIGDPTPPVPPWRLHSRRPRPPDTELVPSVGSASMRPILIDDSADSNGDTQIDDDSEDAGIDDSIRTNICVSCKGNSGCKMASVPWFGQQMCTLCFNMNFAMLMIKEGDLEGRYCFALNAALQPVLDKSVACVSCI